MELLQNIKELTNFNLDLASITVLGMAFGANKESLPQGLIDQDNERVWFRTEKGVAFRFTKETPLRIVEFALFPTVLGELQLKRKKHIQLCFGPADAIEIMRGRTFYFYEDQKIVITWDNENDCLFSLYLGENFIQQTRYSIKDFLKMFQEFKAMVPDTAEWQLNRLKWNEPRYYRLKQLQSLMLAFNLGTDLLSDVQNRGFLKHRSAEDLAPIINDLQKYIDQSPREQKRQSSAPADPRPEEFVMLIQSFFRFSEEMRRLIGFNSDWIETGSVTSRYSIYKTTEVLKSIDLKGLEEIEALLFKILNPQERIFSKSELVEQYNFPDVDLETIDSDNF